MSTLRCGTSGVKRGQSVGESGIFGSPTAEQMAAAIRLAADDNLFFGYDGMYVPKDPTETSGVKPYVLCNDTFGYATADCEEIRWDECPDLEAKVRAGGWPEAIQWVMDKRKAEPLPKLKSGMHVYRDHVFRYNHLLKLTTDFVRAERLHALAEQDPDDMTDAERGPLLKLAIEAEKHWEALSKFIGECHGGTIPEAKSE